MLESNKKDVKIQAGDIRIYLSQVMKRAYSNPELSANDVKALASIAMGLDQFIKNSDRSDMASQALYSALQRIASEGIVKVENIIANKEKNTTELVTESQKLVTETGRYLYLGNIIGTGGEGTVYKIPSMPGKVAKIYKSYINREEKERHLIAFSHNNVPAQLDNMLIATVPEERIYTETGKFVGYVMSQVSSQFKIYDVMRETSDRSKFFPNLDYRGLIVIAYNLAEVVDTLHKHNVVIGDMNLGNIVVNTDGTVCLIDADSFDIVDPISNERFPCCVGTPELLAPELQMGGSIKGLFSKEADYFSLAIIIFRLLMNNADPFGSISFDDETSMMMIPENNPIKNGECPYVRLLEEKAIPLWAPEFNTLPENIQELFIRAFDYDSNNYSERIKNRPSAREWMKALMEYYQMPLVQCKKNGFHWYKKELSECPFCAHKDFSTDMHWIKVGI